MATDGGVSCYDGASFTNYTFEKNGIPSAHVHGIAQSRDGDIWAATSGGIWRLGGGEYKTYTKADGLPNDQVQRVFEDSMGYLWFSTWGGLCRYDGEVFQTLTVEDGLAGSVVMSI
jgi:ligand-binding sensor domain-containing protein